MPMASVLGCVDKGDMVAAFAMVKLYIPESDRYGIKPETISRAKVRRPGFAHIKPGRTRKQSHRHLIGALKKRRELSFNQCVPR